MEDFRFNGKTRFGHFYDVTDKEEQILFHRCSLRVEAYIKAHVYNQEDVYNLRQEVLLQDIFFLGLSFREAGEKRGISKSTCFRLYKKILNKIRKMLDERGIKFTFEDDDL